jgi:putative transposase
MCEVLAVNRTSFHDWERRAPSDRALSDAWLTEKIKHIHAASDGTYGARRVHAELCLEHGVRVGGKRVERLMRAAGLSGARPRKRRRTTVRLAGVRVACDLVERDFRPTGPNLTWAADITYISTWEGFLYLAHVQDLFSRLIVGWSMAEDLRAQLVISALEMAVRRRRPNPGLIHHSDHGGQYTAVLFVKRCEHAGIEISMGSVGDCYDNAVCEAFHATVKKERIYRQAWPTRAQARTAVFAYIEGFYNPRRRHSTLGYLSPAEFERHHAEQPTRALEPISANGSFATVAPPASDGLRTRRASTAGVDFAADGSKSPEPPPSIQPFSLRPRRTMVKDKRNSLASPLGSQAADSLIQTSTTQGKTCRPNRGRSRAWLRFPRNSGKSTSRATCPRQPGPGVTSDPAVLS